MLKRISFCFVALLFVALLMTAGCAKQEVVKKDEGITPVQVTKPVEMSKSTMTPTNQEALIPANQPALGTVSVMQSQKRSDTSKLQSALDKIYFNFDSSDLSESARSTLTKNAALLAKDTTAKIRIEGNCDERGSAEYNLALGERRAKSAQQYLTNLGIKAERLSTVSYGEEKPAVQGNDEESWSKNRRDEFVVTP